MNYWKFYFDDNKTKKEESFLQIVGQITTICREYFLYILSHNRKEKEIMTLSDLCEILCKSESTLRNQFPRTQEAYAKKGVIITREGKGDDADYTVTFPDGTKLE